MTVVDSLPGREAKQAKTVELTAHSLYLQKLTESLRTKPLRGSAATGQGVTESGGADP
jgi:hypothetical protein